MPNYVHPKDLQFLLFVLREILNDTSSFGFHVCLMSATLDPRGILNYFEQTGGAHWNGECFVFDRRVGIAGDLTETATEVCWSCREPLTVEEQKNPAFVQGVSCPYCIEGKA